MLEVDGDMLEVLPGGNAMRREPGGARLMYRR